MTFEPKHDGGVGLAQAVIGIVADRPGPIIVVVTPDLDKYLDNDWYGCDPADAAADFRPTETVRQHLRTLRGVVDVVTLRGANQLPPHFIGIVPASPTMLRIVLDKLLDGKI